MYGRLAILSEEAATAILPSLKRILDSPKLMPKFTASAHAFSNLAAGESGEQGQFPLASCFTDIIPEVINGGILVSLYPYLILRHILEILQITVYKADLTSKQKQETGLIISSIKSVTPLLHTSANSDCKIIYLNLSQLLVRVSKNLICVSSVATSRLILHN